MFRSVVMLGLGVCEYDPCGGGADFALVILAAGWRIVYVRHADHSRYL